MAIPNPNPNIADGLKCDNKTYSSNKIESLIKVATELPIPEAGDAGKVLTVNSDADGYELDNVGGIPSIASGDAGKVITVNAGETAYELATPVAPESIIDDSEAATDTVYSSSKVDTLLSGKADNSNTPKISTTSWGTSVSVTYIKSHFIIIVGSKFYAAWFAGDGLTGINLRDIGTDTNVTGTNTATNGAVTITRTTNGFTVTVTNNTTITVIG